LFSQTIFLIWSFNLWSMEWSKLADWKIQNALKAHDYRSQSIYKYNMTGEVIIQLPR
jgi:hypothetical protein